MVRRPVDAGQIEALVETGMHPVAARVLAARMPKTPVERVSPSLSVLDKPDGLPNIDNAVVRIVTALDRGQVIGLVSDHDVDGTTAMSVLYEALVRHFGHRQDRIRCYIGHRLKEGYGLSDGVVQRIVTDALRPELVITADCGSSDEVRIAQLRKLGIDTICTDHHELPRDGAPRSAFACVSPALPESRYPDRMIAGCMVAWLLMCAVRRELVRTRRLRDDAVSLARSLDYVALGTVADCVSLARSVNNRAAVRYGLQLIAKGARPAWRAMRSFIGDAPRLSALDLAFQIGPRINARGRLDEAMAGVRFLLATKDETAIKYAKLLDEENERRKVIERTLTDTAVIDADSAVADGKCGLAIWLPEGHPGVHGIVASRLVERFGRPAACLSPKFGCDGMATGSVRGVAGVHVRNLLEQINERGRGILSAFGGHEGAGGVTLAVDAVGTFQQLFDEAVRESMNGKELAPTVFSDGEIGPDQIGPGLVEALALLEPYGREFPEPIFEGRFRVDAVRPVGRDASHLQITLRHAKGAVSGIWFNGSTVSIMPGGHVHIAFSPELKWFKNEWRLQVRVRGLISH